MYSRILASDASWNGRFFTGVLTTGIYCLPSCRAKKPRPENVRFFPSCEAAREAGLRPCLKCHPDDFARGSDPVMETIEALVGEIRANPAAFPDARSVVRRSGFGTTRCFELFRQHFHATPADLLLVAYGFDPVPFPAEGEFAAIATEAWGGIKVDAHQMTSLPGVFSGGDSVRGPSLVVHAVRDGRRAAQGIHRHLQSRLATPRA